MTMDDEYPLARLSSAANEMPLQSQAWLGTFAQVMALLSETFRAEMSPTASLGYRKGLSDLTEQELRLACNQALKKHLEFMPTPGQLRGYLKEAREETIHVKANVFFCPRCTNTGWYIPEGKDTAKRCTHL